MCRGREPADSVVRASAQLQCPLGGYPTVKQENLLGRDLFDTVRERGHTLGAAIRSLP
jgi:hypothetical protein